MPLKKEMVTSSLCLSFLPALWDIEQDGRSYSNHFGFRDKYQVLELAELSF